MVVESKYAASGRARLSRLSDKTVQMSEDWVKAKIEEMHRHGSPEVRATAALLRENFGQIQRRVNVLKGDGVNSWTRLRAPAAKGGME